MGQIHPHLCANAALRRILKNVHETVERPPD